ncbi:hypothetical protein O9993_16615 [Vibrio lentus]|nr:hypothetical protein [Vibrio lentus]
MHNRQSGFSFGSPPVGADLGCVESVLINLNTEDDDSVTYYLAVTNNNASPVTRQRASN